MTIRVLLILIAMVLVLVFSTPGARADDPDFSFDVLKFSTPPPGAPRWSLELLGTALGDVTNRHVVMGGLTGGVGYYVFDNFAFNLDVTGYGFNEGRSSGAAAGVTLGIRHHIFHYKKTSVFVDLSGGEIEASNNIPYGGTHLNDTLIVGIGMARPIAPNVSLMAGVRYFHISNARSEGPDRNPSVNAIQGVLGLIWRL